ncbi:MBL fold metallo-hydrolase [Candidatus Parcubacteria bacterium]|nr:MBL fold metallo-hydrolase [Candidatus Parcubacteria bacterium]
MFEQISFFHHRRLALLIGLIAFINAFIWSAVIGRAETGSLSVRFFDVGQGDAIFIETPAGRQILIDGGPSDRILTKLSAVLGFWDRDLDLVISTHPDADHVGGLADVLGQYRVAAVLETGIRRSVPEAAAFDRAVAFERTQVVFAKAGQLIDFGDGAVLMVLNPGTSVAGESIEKTNDYGIVSRLVHSEVEYLFTADVTSVVEGRLVVEGFNLASDVLKVGHHGSKYSSSALFLSAVQPQVAAISAGAKNPYGHPTPEMLDRLHAANIRVYRTDEQGDVVVESDGEGFVVRVAR